MLLNKVKKLQRTTFYSTYRDLNFFQIRKHEVIKEGGERNSTFGTKNSYNELFRRTFIESVEAMTSTFALAVSMKVCQILLITIFFPMTPSLSPYQQNPLVIETHGLSQAHLQ